MHKVLLIMAILIIAGCATTITQPITKHAIAEEYDLYVLINPGQCVCYKGKEGRRLLLDCEPFSRYADKWDSDEKRYDLGQNRKQCAGYIGTELK